jgi:hypothetical protein
VNAILTGIYNRYSGNATLKAALPGGLYLEMTPQSAALPFGTYQAISARPEYWLGGRRFEVVRIDFDIYADTGAKRMTAYGALIALYDDARPTVTGYSSIIMERTLQQFVRDGDQNEIFRAIVTYECRFLKT